MAKNAQDDNVKLNVKEVRSQRRDLRAIIREEFHGLVN